MHPDETGIYSIIDDAADTLRFVRTESFLDDDDTQPPRYVGRTHRAAARRRLIRSTRQGVARLREVLADGWDVGPELAYEERRLAVLEAAIV